MNNADRLRQILRGRIAKPDGLKGVAVVLASAASNLMTVHTVGLDGGWLAW